MRDPILFEKCVKGKTLSFRASLGDPILLEGVLKGKLDAYDVASGFINDMNTFVDAFATQFNSIHSSGNALGQASSSMIMVLL